MVMVHSVADLIQPHCCMTTIALKDANYSVKISEEGSKCLKFYSGKKSFQICCAAKWIVFRSTKVYKAH